MACLWYATLCYYTTQTIIKKAIKRGMLLQPIEYHVIGIYPYHQTFIEDAETDTQALIIYDSKKIVLAFRGSMTLGDWKINMSTRSHSRYSNLETAKVPFILHGTTETINDMGLVHKGFYTAVSTVWLSACPIPSNFTREPIINIIQTVRTDSQKIWLCGHSLGGALATLCSLQYRHMKIFIHRQDYNLLVSMLLAFIHLALLE